MSRRRSDIWSSRKKQTSIPFSLSQHSNLGWAFDCPKYTHYGEKVNSFQTKAGVMRWGDRNIFLWNVNHDWFKGSKARAPPSGWRRRTGTKQFELLLVFFFFKRSCLWKIGSDHHTGREVFLYWLNASFVFRDSICQLSIRRKEPCVVVKRQLAFCVQMHF